jgi:hypothetical protein
LYIREKKCNNKFYVWLTVHHELYFIIIQHDTLYIFTLLGYHISTRFGPIRSPSSGTSSFPSRSADRRLRSKTNTTCHVYTIYLLMMGYKWARNMYRCRNPVKARYIVHAIHQAPLL